MSPHKYWLNMLYLIAAVLSTTVTCPAGFRYIYDACYRIHTQRLGWIDASIAAAQQNASLASIRSEPQSRWIAEFLGTKGWPRNIGGDGLWLGLHDISNESDWQYVDGSPVQFSLWDYREPDGGDSENCAWLGYYGRWSDRRCSLVRHSLLEWKGNVSYFSQGKVIIFSVLLRTIIISLFVLTY